MTHSLRRIPAISALLALSAAPLFADPPQRDATFDQAMRVLVPAFREMKTRAISKTDDTAQVISALRSARDKELLPLFLKFRESQDIENQIYGMVSASVLTKDTKQVDLKLLFSGDASLSSPGLATLIDEDVVTDEQLYQVLTSTDDPSRQAMALVQLDKHHAIKDRSVLLNMLNTDRSDMVRYLSAITILQDKNPDEIARALKTLNDMEEKNEPRQAPAQALMMVRAQKENITAAEPWVRKIAEDEKNDDGLRHTAIGVLFCLKSPEAPRILADMIQKQREIIQQVKLGLVALEFADQLRPSALDPLVKAKSQLTNSIAKLAVIASQAGPGSSDVTDGIVKLLKEGHAIVLDWALAYADRAPEDRAMALRITIINQATIVDNNRGRDYERAVVATEKILDKKNAAGRNRIAELLKSDNRAVVEAVLAGIYRSSIENQSELVLPVWDKLTKSSATETAANYAALILAREGKKEALPWLPGMIQGGTVQNAGFRGLAGWYYAKLTGQSDAMIKQLLAI